MTDEVFLKIKSCEDCPNMRQERFYTEDSWEYIQEWKCRISENKRISLQEMFDKIPPIPDWCPLRGEKDES